MPFNPPLMKTLFLILFSAFLQGQLYAQTADTLWWKNTVVYQIYPRSFNDSDNDGIGDLQGIIEKLDYLKELGVETIWISPFFQSPHADFGYDISNYYKVDSLFGDKNSISNLIQAIHQRGMYVVFDLVMNHTSQEHHWFQESAQDSLNEKANWYVWKTGRKNNKRPPNNWKATIGGSGWHFHPLRKQWYFTSFLEFQPDLNYHHPATKKAMLDVARHWLAEGVDGFRLDIFNVIYEDKSFKNNPFSWRSMPSSENPDGFNQKMKYTVNHPQNTVFAKELRIVLDSFGKNDRFAVGEVFGDHEAIKGYLGEHADGLNLAFNFDMLAFKFKAHFFADKIKTYEEHYPSPLFPTLVFSNHDRKRSISRIGDDPEKAKLIACFQLTARGTPFLYQGEEIGMTQKTIPTKKALDPLALKYKWIPQFLVNMSKEALNRDACRTPMQWNNSPNSGFCDASTTPWLPLNDDFKEINVQTAQKDSTSLWWVYRNLLALRKQHKALHAGSIELIPTKPKNILAYKRSFGAEQFAIFINFSKKENTVDWSNKGAKIVYSLSTKNVIDAHQIKIQGLSALIVRL